MKNYHAIDLFKFLASIFVVAIHTNPLMDFSFSANVFLTDVLARLAVPFFFISSGFFLYAKFEKKEKNKLIFAYMKRLFILYGLWSILYLPLNFLKWVQSGFDPFYWIVYIQTFLFDGSYYTLWFFPGLIFAVYLAQLIYGKISDNILLPCCLLLYILGALGQPYYELLPESALLNGYYALFLSTRNGLFFGFPFLCLGMWAKKSRRKIPRRRVFLFFLINFALLIFEVFRAYGSGMNFVKGTGMWIFVLPSAFFLFLLAKEISLKNSPIYYYLRKMSTLIYLSHGLFIILYAIVIQKIIPNLNSLGEFLLILLPTIVLSHLLISLGKTKAFHFLTAFYE